MKRPMVRLTPAFAAIAACAAIALGASDVLVTPVGSQELARPSAWLDKLDREHDRLVPKAGHAHGRGRVEAVDTGPGTITILTEEIQSPDKSIWMPAMRMVFHVTNRRMLIPLRSGDSVEFVAARLRNAVMITSIRKVRKNGSGDLRLPTDLRIVRERVKSAPIDQPAALISRNSDGDGTGHL